jgi:hypothetical protein
MKSLIIFLLLVSSVQAQGPRGPGIPHTDPIGPKTLPLPPTK